MENLAVLIALRMVMVASVTKLRNLECSLVLEHGVAKTSI